MEVQELRIGNWVNVLGYDTNHDHKFVEWDAEQITSLPMGCSHSEWNICANYHDYDFDEIQPIPLTEEWLIKFGFEKFKNDFIGGYNFMLDLIHLNISDNKVLVWYNGGCRFSHIQNVHQLQNLYHSLTGKELTIKE